MFSDVLATILSCKSHKSVLRDTSQYCAPSQPNLQRLIKPIAMTSNHSAETEEKKTSRPYHSTGTEEKKTSRPYHLTGTEEKKTSRPYHSTETEEKKTSRPYHSAGTEEKNTSRPYHSAGTEEKKTSRPLRAQQHPRMTTMRTLTTKEVLWKETPRMHPLESKEVLRQEMFPEMV